MPAIARTGVPYLAAGGDHGGDALELRGPPGVDLRGSGAALGGRRDPGLPPGVVSHVPAVPMRPEAGGPEQRQQRAQRGAPGGGRAQLPDQPDPVVGDPAVVQAPVTPVDVDGVVGVPVLAPAHGGPSGGGKWAPRGAVPAVAGRMVGAAAAGAGNPMENLRKTSRQGLRSPWALPILRGLSEAWLCFEPGRALRTRYRARLAVHAKTTRAHGSGLPAGALLLSESFLTSCRISLLRCPAPRRRGFERCLWVWSAANAA